MEPELSENEEPVEKILYYDFVPHDAQCPILRTLMYSEIDEEE